MKVLVTGSSGFIGAKVAEQLLDGGHSVVGVDDMNDYYDVRLKQWRLNRLEQHTNASEFMFSQEDIVDLDAMKRIFEGAGFDAVLNLAARAGVRYSVENPWVYVDTNTRGTLNLLEQCRAHDVPRLVLASTSSLYGAHNERPFKESANTDRPLSPYAATKKGAEAMAASYTHLYGIHTPVFRYFTVYGPAGRPDMSVFRFIKWISEGVPLTLYGDGSQERDFTFVDDIARGTILGLGLDGHSITNLGNDNPHTINDVIGMIEARLGKKAQIDHKPMHDADVKATWADITRARKVLGWAPTTGLEDGIHATCDWYLENEAWLKSVDAGEL